MQPLTDRLRNFTEKFTDDPTLSPAQRLIPLAGEIATVVAYIQRTAGDPHGTGRANLESLVRFARHLARLAEEALAAEPRP